MDPLEDQLRSGDDLADWVVYADRLLQRGDPRGELVALSIALEHAADADREPILARTEKLIEELDGPLVELAARGDMLELDWRYGFVGRARVVEPWEQRVPAAQLWLSEFLASPVTRFMRALEIDREGRRDVSLGELGRRGIFEWAAPVITNVALPQLRSFRVGHDPSDRMFLSRTSSSMVTSGLPPTPGARICRPDRYVGDLDRALANMPNLHHLHITGEGIRIGILPPKLRTLTIETRFLRRSSLRAIGGASLPELRELELWLGHWPDSSIEFEGSEGEEYYGIATGPGDLTALLDGCGVPALRELALVNCAWMPDVLSAVATSPLLPRLERLDLSWGFMTSDDVRPLIEHADRFRHLRCIDLSHNLIEDRSMQGRLLELFGQALLIAPQGGLGGSAAARVFAF